MSQTLHLLSSISTALGGQGSGKIRYMMRQEKTGKIVGACGSDLEEQRHACAML